MRNKAFLKPDLDRAIQAFDEGKINRAELAAYAAIYLWNFEFQNKYPNAPKAKTAAWLI